MKEGSEKKYKFISHKIDDEQRIISFPHKKHIHTHMKKSTYKIITIYHYKCST